MLFSDYCGGKPLANCPTHCLQCEKLSFLCALVHIDRLWFQACFKSKNFEIAIEQERKEKEASLFFFFVLLPVFLLLLLFHFFFLVDGLSPNFIYMYDKASSNSDSNKPSYIMTKKKNENFATEFHSLKHCTLSSKPTTPMAREMPTKLDLKYSMLCVTSSRLELKMAWPLVTPSLLVNSSTPLLPPSVSSADSLLFNLFKNI